MDKQEVLSQSSFSMLEGKVDSRLLAAVKSMKLIKPTQIQAETLPHLLMGKDVVGASKTGSGKTLAFLLPVIENLLRMKFTRQNGVGCIILSPTHNKVEKLAKLALRSDHIFVCINDDMQSTVSGLQQGYCLCCIENRIPWLYKMLKKGKKMKIMVFFSSCKSVDFHYEFFKVYCKAPVLSIHGKQTQARRKETYLNFLRVESGVLFCTDVAARGLDIPSVDWIVQYDAPTDPKKHAKYLLLIDYSIKISRMLCYSRNIFHRVGRTARGLNKKGNAVILLRPEEESFIEFVKRKKIYLDKYSFENPSEEVQTMLEMLVSTNGVIKTLARKAYLAFLRSYKTHPLKKIFNIKTLDLKLAARAFGFLEQPHVDCSILS
ncbi:hypothetical protein ACJJTC_019806 [Scirpophaga incertulas]